MIEEALNLHLPLWEIAVRLGTALVFAGMIGWEREVNRRAAGLRTHMLVALGAAGFTLVSLELVAANHADGGVAGDPIRIIQAVATGVGFLGAGAIMQSGMQVKGLTTAASIWVVSATGVAAGAGYWVIALLLSALALITLTFLRLFERPEKK